MPYFYRNDGGDNDVNLLFVHIPKTGGTSFENYMSKRYDIPLNHDSLYKQKKGEPTTYQHFTLQSLWKRRQEFGIREDGLRIIAFVRNPYDRMISELLYLRLMDRNTPPDDVATIIRRYLNSSSTYDNHKLPQIDFVVDSSGHLWDGVEIAHLENITEELSRIGFDDFNNWDYANSERKADKSMDYSQYLNDKSIQLINDYYFKDFEAFGYDRIDPSDVEGFANYESHESESPVILTILLILLFLILLFLYRFGNTVRKYVQWA